ncbi:MAG: hypothetical protein FWG88_00065 [Oscillospiraceae bacterium]|nr:hypothetical protein [Oscillospiraceae bacterium]
MDNYNNDKNNDNNSDKKVFELLSLLASTSSTLAKRDILQGEIENKDLWRFLDYLLNPFLITGISAKKIAKDTAKEASRDFSNFAILMEYIYENNTGSDEVIANIRGFLSKQNEEMRSFYESIITKSLRIGCDAKSVNKAYGQEFIPQWEVQQAYNLEKSPLKDGEWFSLTEKLNGVRGTYFEGNIISRQGKEFSGLEHIIESIALLLADSENTVLDGELVRINSDGLSDNENFRIGTGLLGKYDADKSSIRFVVFDLLPKSEFLAGESELTYKDRLEALNNLGNEAKKQNLESIAQVDVLYSGVDQSQIDYFLDIMESQDKEGLMLNRDRKYQRKRHNGILKVKKFYSIDLEVLSVEEGSGRLKGKLGSFVVDYKGNKVNVGSGISDEERSLFWENRENLPGRVIEVQYKEESSDKKTGLLSLQFPIFKSLREEGKEVSYY